MMSKSKVWIVTYNFGSVKAGPVLRFMKYAPYFEANNIETIFVSKRRDNDKNQMDDIEIKSIYIDCDNPNELTKKAINTAINAKNKPDCILFFSVDHQSYFHFLKAKANGIKLIYVSTMHFNLRQKEFGRSRKLLPRLLLFLLLNITFRLFNYIVCSTNLLKDNFLKLNVDPNKLKVIYNGVDTKKFKPVSDTIKQEIRVKYNLPIAKVIILFVGLFVERKGVEYLLKLTNSYIRSTRNSNLLLLMVGEEMLDITENSISFKINWPILKMESIENGLARFDSFSNEIHEYYKASDIFVFPSKVEGMPNVLLESMSVGLPVIVNKFEGFSEDYGTPGLHFDWLSYNIEKDMETLGKYILSLEKRIKLGNCATRFANDYFDFDKSIQSYIQLLK